MIKKTKTFTNQSKPIITQITQTATIFSFFPLKYGLII